MLVPGVAVELVLLILFNRVNLLVFLLSVVVVRFIFVFLNVVGRLVIVVWGHRIVLASWGEG